ncbi:uncharacterized protein LOC136091136 [Hydra vulgaris]|uniref:Uncharacterized protein LOC136091136 n=1 Tax=Hydra vulgaris TaxID=6087 RepID=A0ABM4DI59_HYDVU
MLSNIWLKILTKLNNFNLILQNREITVSTELLSIKSLLKDLEKIRYSWDLILNEAKTAAEKCDLVSTFKEEHNRKRNKKYFENFNERTLTETPEQKFRKNVFDVIIGSVIRDISTRFKAIQKICDTFDVLWSFNKLEEMDVVRKAKILLEKYEKDINNNLVEIDKLFPNLTMMLRIFCCLPVTVAEAERSFNRLSRIKNQNRSTVGQNCLNDLAKLCIECELAKELIFDSAIKEFANKKSRKVILN